MNKEQLQKQIKEQEEKNISLFKIFDNKFSDKEMQPFIQEWYKGSSRLKALDEELYKIIKQERDQEETLQNKTNINKTFINGYGEATKRYITTATYERAEKRRQKEIVSFLGRR